MSKKCTNKGRCYRFAYTVQGHKDRELQPFQLRDGEAGAHVWGAIAARGYTYAGSIINYPSLGPDLIPIDFSRLRPTDLILLTTRPPMDDRNIGNRRRISRSFTALEEGLFNLVLRRYFARCARSEVQLTDEAARISPAIAERQKSEFYQNLGAGYSAYGPLSSREWRYFRSDDPRPPTAAFLVYEEQVWPGGPGLLAAFGMGGTETLVWAYHLANRFSHLLLNASFVMAELRAPERADQPMWMDFADAWDVEILGVAKSPRVAGTRPRPATVVPGTPGPGRPEGPSSRPDTIC